MHRLQCRLPKVSVPSQTCIKMEESICSKIMKNSSFALIGILSITMTGDVQPLDGTVTKVPPVKTPCLAYV